MKVLYTFYHGAAFAWSLIHKLTIHPNDEAYLLVGNGWDWCAGNASYLPLLQKFVKAGFFEKICLYDNRIGRDKDKYDTLEKTEQAILVGLDKVLESQKCEITSFDRIYSHTDGEDTIGIYLSLKKCQFYWFENAPRLLKLKTEQYVRSVYNEHKGYQAAMLKHKTLFGESEYQSYILYPNSDANGFPSERCQIFDAEKVASDLAEEIKQQILKCFDMKNCVCPDNAAMLLLQSSWIPSQIFEKNTYIKKCFKTHLEYMYYSIQCMLDYYLPPNAVPILKTHPWQLIDDKISKKYFNGVYAFHSLFTVLLTKSLLPEYVPKYRVLLGSTSNKQLTAKEGDIYCPGVWLYSLFCNKYYIACDILNTIGLLDENAYKVFRTIGKAGNILNYDKDYMPLDINSMISINFPNAKKYNDASFSVLHVFDEELELSISKYDFVIFTDIWNEMTNEKYKELAQKYCILKIKLHKEVLKNKNNILEPLGAEYVYILSQNKKWGNILEPYYVEKEKSYTGIKLIAHVDSFSVVEKKHEPYAVGSNINLYECYQRFGSRYKDLEENEICIEGKFTERTLENMRAISILFSGKGNKIIFSNLDTPQRISGNFRIEALNSSKITIGKLYFANHGVLIHSANSEIVIEDDVMFANNVVVRAMNYHSIYEFNGKRLPNRNLYIGKHVWLGYNATIYAGSIIGTGSIIGAGSVVGGRIPNNCVAVGNPAKVVRKDVFWQWHGNVCDYYDLPENMRTVGEYIAKTEEN